MRKNHQMGKRPVPARNDRSAGDFEFLNEQAQLPRQTLQETLEELAASRERYARLFDSAPVASLRLSGAGRILDVNLAGARLLGKPRARLTGTPLINSFVAEDRGKFLRHLYLGARNPAPTVTELQLRRHDGERPVFVELISVPGDRGQGGKADLNAAFIDVSRRKLSEQLVMENEQRFRALSENVAEATVLLTAKGRIFYQSASVQRLLGYSIPELGAQPPPQGLIHMDDLPRALIAFQGILETEECQREVELRIRHKDGSWRWLQIVAKNLLHEPAVAGIVLNARDVTEQRETYDALRVNEEHLRMAQNAGGVGSFDFDVRSGRISISETFAEIIGLSRRRRYLTLRDWQSRVHRQDRAQMRRHWARALSGEEQVASEYRIIRAGERRPRWVVVAGRVYRDSRGAPQRLVGTLQDITERVASRLILQRSKSELETLVALRTAELLRREQEMDDFFEQSPVGMLWVGANGRIVRMNRAQLELLGRPGAEVLGERVADFHAPGEQIPQLLRRLARGETVRNLRMRVLHKSGAIRQVLVDANGHWKKGRLAYSRWFVRDITHRTELEREILQIAERERQRIGRDLHDDLCQQLTGIEFLSHSLASQLQKSSGHGVERAREIAQMVRDAITHTRELAHGLSPMRLGLQQTLHELAVRTRKLFHVDCRFRCKKAILSEDDAVNIHLYRIAQESVSNAIKHGKARRIDIELARQGNKLVLAVRDFGGGMPANAQERGGMGLRVMQYRAGVIGGNLTVEPNPRGGTTVICAVSDQVVEENGKFE